jgi:hypothetical protein
VGISGFFSSAKRKTLMLQPAQLVHLARVQLDIQDRCIEAFLAGGAKALQLRHELFEQYLVTYQVRLVENGFEHQLAVSLDGTIDASMQAAVRIDTLRLLAYVVRIGRLGPVYPFDVNGLRLSVSRVLTVDESKRLQRKPDLSPPAAQAAALFVASEGDAANLIRQLPT